MSAVGYRYKAQRYLTRARQMSSSDARWTMIELATYWMRLAELAEHHKAVTQQQRHIEADKDNSWCGAAEAHDTFRDQLVAVRDELTRAPPASPSR
jgi:hypothetical protein